MPRSPFLSLLPSLFLVLVSEIFNDSTGRFFKIRGFLPSPSRRERVPIPNVITDSFFFSPPFRCRGTAIFLSIPQASPSSSKRVFFKTLFSDFVDPAHPF